jgi:hypothetical protein
MSVVRMTLREWIAGALHDHDHMHTWDSESCDDACGTAAFQRADIVLAILGTRPGVLDLPAAHPAEPAPTSVEICFNDGPAHPRTECHVDRCGLEAAEPASGQRPSDAAVEAAQSVYRIDPPYMRDALKAAYRVDAPRPLLDREAVQHALQLHWWDEDSEPCACGFDFLAAGQGWKHHLADAVLELARPMPTQEAVMDMLANEGVGCNNLKTAQELIEHRTGVAASMLALINQTTRSEP